MVPERGDQEAPVDCEYRGEHRRIDERLDQLEVRADKHDTALDGVKDAVGGVKEELAALRGQIQGALAASKMGGAIVGALLGVAGSAAVGLLIFLLERSGRGP